MDYILFPENENNLNKTLNIMKFIEKNSNELILLPEYSHIPEEKLKSFIFNDMANNDDNNDLKEIYLYDIDSY
jgi:hypothetical protein